MIQKVIFLLLLLFLTACDKERLKTDCATIETKIENATLLDLATCKKSFNDRVINSDSLYQEVFEESYFQETGQSLPPVDFLQKTVLVRTVFGGCNFKLITSDNFIDPGSLSYTLNITVKSKGWCKKQVFYTYVIAVPKIPGNYTISFNEIPED